MREDVLPTTSEGRLTHLVEECSEVIKAVCKLQRFGGLAFDPVTGTTYDNITELCGEVRDLERAIRRWKEEQ